MGAPLIHGQSANAITPTYTAWLSMKQRCYYPKYAYFHRYGGRGIKVCERWRRSFQNFFADMGARPSGMTLGRIDNDKDYGPGNCRWETRTQQQRNRVMNRMLTFEGQTRCLSEWAEIKGLTRTALDMRLRKGKTVEEALSSPPRVKRVLEQP